MRKLSILFVNLLILNFAFAQKIEIDTTNTMFSVHEQQSKYFSEFSFQSESQWDKFNNIVHQEPYKSTTKPKKSLTKEVIGWNPYWMGTAYYDYDYSLLSEVSYFSYEVNYLTGKPDNIHYWLTTQLLDYAHNSGTRVSLTATLFSNHQAFFDNSTAVQMLIDSLISLVKYRNADGVNIDFEQVSSTQKAKLTAFMINIANKFHAEIPGSKVSIALPAVDWSETFDVAAMNQYVDLFLIMGYEYYWSSSAQAGPGAPQYSGDIWSSYNTTKSILYYLSKGVSPDKLCLAVPYYGREWTTQSNTFPSNTTASGSAVTYKDYRKNYSATNNFRDLHSNTPVNIYKNSAEQWKQCWQNDEISNADKYEMINMLDIGGIGIWALGYDAGYYEQWEAIKEKLSDYGNTQCQGIFMDTGGKYGKYYNSEDWTYTIAPKNATRLAVKFQEFDIENNFDSLFIYDGKSVTANLIGKFTGTNIIKDTIKTTTGAITFRFKSDKATINEGWVATWKCINQASNITENKDFNIILAPNPFQNTINIKLQDIDIKDINIYCYNLLGQKINFISEKQHNNININFTDNIPSGIYIIYISNQYFSQTYKITKL